MGILLLVLSKRGKCPFQPNALGTILFFHGPRTRTQGMFTNPKPSFSINFQDLYSGPQKKKSQFQLCVLGSGLTWASIHDLGLNYSATTSLTRC